MFSGDEALSAVKFERQSSARSYTPEFRIRSAAATAASQAVPPPIDTAEQELYDVALGASLVNTPAFRYMLARMASAAPLVIRPWSDAGQLLGSAALADSSSCSMNWNTSAREPFGRSAISMSVTIGTPPNMSMSW